MTSLTEADVDQLKSALLRLGFFVLELNSTNLQIRLSGRVKGVEALNSWDTATDHLLNDHPKWKVDVSRAYCKIPGRGKVYYWRLIFQSPTVLDNFSELLQFLKSIPKPTKQVMYNNDSGEVMLYGSRGTKGRVGPIGTVPVGPAAIGRR